MSFLDDALVIRLAEQNDVPHVVAIEQQVHHDPMSESMIQNELSVEQGRFWVVFAQAQVVAYAMVWIVMDQAELHNIAVAASHQRQGIARKLMRWICDDVRALDVTNMFLEVREGNLPARQLYERLGFEAVGVRRKYYQHPVEDAVVMSLDVTSL